MDVIIEKKNNCYNMSEGQFVIEWANNKSTDEIIEIVAYPIIPQLFYNEWNDTHYQWCGPMLLIVEYFAKFTNTK